MPIALLPASAAAFAPRSAPTVVLPSRVESWLTQTLKRINRVKRPLNSVSQHYRCLSETLAGPSAIWTLCSIMLPKAPASELRTDSNPLVEAIFNYQLLNIEAYVVHVDMVSQHEVAFKLTTDTIDALIEYHRDIFSVDASANTWDWPEKESHLKKLQDDFVQAVNRYVFRTGVHALEGLEEDGAGELLEGRSDNVKNALTGLFLPLLPPPPRLVDVIHPQPVRTNSAYVTGNCSAGLVNGYRGVGLGKDNGNCNTSVGNTSGDSSWWQSSQHSLAQSHLQPAPVDAWRVLPSSSPTPSLSTSVDSQPMSTTSSSPFWTALNAPENQLPSPTPSFSLPVTSSSEPLLACSMSDLDSLPLCTASDSFPALSSMTPVLPNFISQQCGSSAMDDGFGGFNWSYNGFAPQYATTM